MITVIMTMKKMITKVGDDYDDNNVDDNDDDDKMITMTVMMMTIPMMMTISMLTPHSQRQQLGSLWTPAARVRQYLPPASLRETRK